MQADTTTAQWQTMHRHSANFQPQNPNRRKTWQKDAVIDALSSQKGFVTAKEIYKILENSHKKIGLATVYRALGYFVQIGTVDVVHAEDVDRYRLCENNANHSHIVCRACGITTEIVSKELENLTADLFKKYKYTQPDTSFDLFGTCESCTTSTSA